MRLASLKIKQFRCFEERELNFASPITYITGHNEAGKSTILDAIAWGLTGVCRGTTAGGTGADVLVRLGADQKAMSVEIGGSFGTITRKLGDGPRSAVGVAIDKKLGVSRDAALVCLSWDAFLQMETKDARTVLMEALGIDVKADAVKKILGEDFEFIKHMPFRGPESILAAYNYAYQLRADTSKALKSIAQPPNMEGHPAELLEMSVAEAEEELRESRDLLGQLVSEIGDLTRAEDVEAGARRERLKAARDEYAKLTARELEMKAGLEAIVIPDAKKLQAEMKKYIKVVEAGQENLDRLRTIEGSEKAHLAMYRERLAALTKHAEGVEQPVTCPTCTAEMSPQQWRKLLHDTKAGIETYTERLSTTQAKIAEIDLGPSRQRVEHLSREADSIQEKVRLRDDAKDALKMLSEAIATLRAEIASLEPTETQEQASLLDAPVQSEELVALTERCERGRAFIAALEAYIPARREFEQVTGQHAKMKVRFDTLDRLVKGLAHSGPVVAACVTPKIAPFVKRINEALFPFGKRAAIQLDPFEILVTGADQGESGRGASEISAERSAEEGWIPMRMLSTSTRLRLGFAIQTAFGAASGFKLVLVDEASILDADCRTAFMEAAETAINSKALEQIILAGTDTAPRDEEDDAQDEPEIGDSFSWQVVTL